MVAAGAACGTRFSRILAADIAFKRLAIADPMHLGNFQVATGDVDLADPEAQAALAALGPNPSVLVDGDGGYAVVLHLEGASKTLFDWYWHVWQSLRMFLATLAGELGEESWKLTEVFVVPGLEDSAEFVRWTVAASTPIFDALGADVALRHLFSNAELEEILDGFEAAEAVVEAEKFFRGKLGQYLKLEHDLQRAVVYVAGILAMPEPEPPAPTTEEQVAAGGVGAGLVAATALLLI